MSLGVVCHWLDTKENNSLKTANLQLGAFKTDKYTASHITNTYLNNINTHTKFLPTLIAQGIKVFRITSALLPLADQVPYHLWRDNEQVRAALARLGAIVKAANLRITTHPGQFVVLSSDRAEVIANSIKELDTHAWVFDAMGLPQTAHYAINIHGGKGDRLSTLVSTIKNLPDNIRLRLTLENDESSYSAADLLRTGTPVVLDTHHHTFNTGRLSLEEAHRLTIATWGGIKPLQHLSNTSLGSEQGSFQERRKHSEYIHYIPDIQLHAIKDNSVDVEIEAKAKQKAVFKLINDFNLKG